MTITLKPSQAMQLMGIVESPGWDVLQMLMEQVLDEADKKHFALDPAQVPQAQIAASHAQTRALRLAIKGLLLRVGEEINGLGRSMPDEPDGDPVEMSIENPLRPEHNGNGNL